MHQVCKPAEPADLSMNICGSDVLISRMLILDEPFELSDFLFHYGN